MTMSIGPLLSSRKNQRSYRIASRGAGHLIRRELSQAIGRSRGGRTTKVHALTDRFCRPLAFLLTGGQVADCTAADALLDQMPAAVILNGDKGTATSSAAKSRAREPLRTFHRRPTDAGRTA